MERREILIEVHREEIKISHAIPQNGWIVLERVVEIIGSLGSKRPDLLVAASIARYEKNGCPSQLAELSVSISPPRRAYRQGH